MTDVLIAGAGPAGSVAALVLARAGLRVRILDRATFPRDKLCGDTVNPGTLAAFKLLGVADDIERRAIRVSGMTVSGQGGSLIRGEYPDSVHGLALLRRDLDLVLLEAALRAGAAFEPGVSVRAPVLDSGESQRVVGLMIDRPGRRSAIEFAPFTIAADGRRSVVAFQLGLARHPVRPRRWAVGAYCEGVDGLAAFGEMHIRSGHYIGVAPLPQGIANVCLVSDFEGRAGAVRDPADLLSSIVRRDWHLGDRFMNARFVSSPVVLGPLAVNATAAGTRGLLLAGDAAGFVDPMTGDGLRFAVEGGRLAALAVLEFLDAGGLEPHHRLARLRATAFDRKLRFNRGLRTLVDSPRALAITSRAATVAPAVLRLLIRLAGDVPHRDGRDRVRSSRPVQTGSGGRDSMSVGLQPSD